MEVSGQLHAQLLYTQEKSPWYPLDGKLEKWQTEKFLCSIGNQTLVIQPVKG